MHICLNERQMYKENILRLFPDVLSPHVVSLGANSMVIAVFWETEEKKDTSENLW